jgi:hypothetical protein
MCTMFRSLTAWGATPGEIDSTIAMNRCLNSTHAVLHNSQELRNNSEREVIKGRVLKCF